MLENEDEMRERLEGLRVEHRDLDEIITRLVENPPADELMMRRIKKRKLLLKDRIATLERLLTPQEPA